MAMGAICSALCLAKVFGVTSPNIKRTSVVNPAAIPIVKLPKKSSAKTVAIEALKAPAILLPISKVVKTRFGCSSQSLRPMTRCFWVSKIWRVLASESDVSAVSAADTKAITHTHKIKITIIRSSNRPFAKQLDLRLHGGLHRRAGLLNKLAHGLQFKAYLIGRLL